MAEPTKEFVHGDFMIILALRYDKNCALGPANCPCHQKTCHLRPHCNLTGSATRAKQGRMVACPGWPGETGCKRMGPIIRPRGTSCRSTSKHVKRMNGLLWSYLMNHRWIC